MKKLLLIIVLLTLSILSSANADDIQDPLGSYIFIPNKGQILDAENKADNDLKFYIKTQNTEYRFKNNSYSISYYDETTDQTYSAKIIPAEFKAKLISVEEAPFHLNFYYSHIPNGIQVRPVRKLIYQTNDKKFILEISLNKQTQKIQHKIISSSNISNSLIIKGNYNDILNIDTQNNFKQENIGNESIKYIPLKNKKATSNEVVDEPQLNWSTFFGGLNGDHAQAICRDGVNSIYMAGNSTSHGLSTDGTTFKGSSTDSTGYDCIISKFSSIGNLQWATYFGGSKNDTPNDIVVDKSQNSYVCGLTWSWDMPTQNGYDQSFNGPFPSGNKAQGTDAFVLKLDNNGKVEWSTYVGGNQSEHFEAIAINSQREIALTGFTRSTNFPTSTDPLKTKVNNLDDAMIFRLDFDGVFKGGYLWGGFDDDLATDIEYTDDNKILICGYTKSGNFELVNLSPTDKSKIENTDLFLFKITTNGEAATVDFSKALGGANNDYIPVMTIDNQKNIILAARTNSVDYPVTPGVVFPTKADFYDACITKMYPDCDILWSGFFGGSEDEYVEGIDIDQDDYIYVCGKTSSLDLPTSRLAMQKEYKGGQRDAFAMKIHPDGSKFEWATYIGGSEYDYSTDILADLSGNALVCGGTESTDFPVTMNSHQEIKSNYFDAYLLKLCATEPYPEIQISGSQPFCPGDSVALVAGGEYTQYIWSNGADTKKAKIFVNKPGFYYVEVIDEFGCWGKSDSVEVKMYEAMEISYDGELGFCEGLQTAVEVQGNFQSIKWNDNNSSSTSRIFDTPGLYYLTAMSSNGCEQLDSVEIIQYKNPEPKIEGEKVVCAFSVTNQYKVTSFPYYEFTWEVDGGTINLGPDHSNIKVTWGGEGLAEVRIKIVDSRTGCIGFDTLFVEIKDKLEPEINTNTGVFYLCEGSTLTLDAGSYDRYVWDDNSTKQFRTIDKEGEYWVKVYDNAGCNGADTIIVTEVPNPTPSILGETDFCFDENIQEYTTSLNANASYTWEIQGATILSGKGTNKIEVEFPSAGTYTLKVTEVNGQTVCEADDEITITVHDIIIPEIIAESAIEFCEGDSVTLDAGAGYTSYLWSSGESTQKITVKTSGDYYVEVTNSNGCLAQSEDISVIVHELPEKPTITQVANQLVTLTYDSYIWYLDDIEIANSNSNEYTPTQSGYYKVKVANSFGCESESDEFYLWIGQASAEIKVDSLEEVKVGDQVDINIRIISSMDLDSVDAVNFRAYLRYNKTVLLPREGDFTDGNTPFELLTLYGSRTDTIGILATAKFTALIGTESCTDIFLDSLVWEGTFVDQTITHGAVCLDICDAGGERLFATEEILALGQNIPNPAEKETRINYTLIEDGYTELILVDIKGNVIKTLLNTNAKAGSYQMDLNLEGLNSGTYFYILKTPTNTLKRSMSIIK